MIDSDVHVHRDGEDVIYLCTQQYLCNVYICHDDLLSVWSPEAIFEDLSICSGDVLCSDVIRMRLD